jgi:hypothetical protein
MFEFTRRIRDNVNRHNAVNGSPHDSFVHNCPKFSPTSTSGAKGISNIYDINFSSGTHYIQYFSKLLHICCNIYNKNITNLRVFLVMSLKVY